MDESSIKQLFQEHGTVPLVSMPRDRNTGKLRGFAFVDMSTAEEMQAAIDALDGTTMGGRTVRVSRSLPKDQLPDRTGGSNAGRDYQKVPEGYKKIYMGNIPFACTNEEIMDYYSDYDVLDVYIPRDSQTGQGRGFAFVTLADADAAIAATNGQEYAGRTLVVSEPLPPGKKAPRRTSSSTATAATSTKLYVGNLSFYTLRDTLEEIFSEFGIVHDCYMPEDASTGGSRGFGFVTMDKEAARVAIDELDGCEVDGRIIRVNEAVPKKRSSRFNDDDDDEFGDDVQDGGDESDGGFEL